jgi:hypothetical protein
VACRQLMRARNVQKAIDHKKWAGLLKSAHCSYWGFQRRQDCTLQEMCPQYPATPMTE